jgi:hypothetical protein
MKLPTTFNREITWITLISMFSLLIHLLTYDNLGFHRDEFLYLALGKHLATGYWSNPPLMGVISFISQRLPGDPMLTTRLLPALAGAFLIFLTGLTAREMGGRLFAQVLACSVLSLSLLILRGFSMLQPVPFDILFWTLILYWLLRYVNSQKNVYILLMGITFGVGMLNKYMVAFLALGLALGVLPTAFRSLWLKRTTWYAVAIALLLFLPNLVWQIQHGFPVIKHMGELAETQLVNVKRMNIVIDQILMFTAGAVIWVAGLLALLSAKWSSRFRVFGYAYLVVLVIFLVFRGKSYYTAGLYPFLFAAGGVAWEKILKAVKWQVAFGALIILLSLPLTPGGIPFMEARKLAAFYSRIPDKMGIEALLRWEDGKTHPLPQDFADMLGWDELAGIVIRACDSIHDKSRIMIYAENYGQAGAIDHYGEYSGLPEPVSFSDSYLLWAPDTIAAGIDLFFYVNDELGKDIDSLFSRIDTLGSITHPYAREFGTTVYLCRSPRKNFPAFWADRLKEVRQEYLE